MRHVSCIVAVAALAGALGGCASPYGYSQSYYQQPGYGYYQQPSYGYYQQPSYSQSGYAYRSSAWDRNYRGIHPGPERFP